MISSSTLVPAQVNDNQTKPTGTAKVTSLKVRIITKRSRGAGTDNAVYFDIGPVAWKLGRAFHNDFEAGDDNTYELDVPAGLTTDDILWLRLHKKGIVGVTGTKDGLAGAWHPESVKLFVNGAEFMKIEPKHALNSRCWYWRSPRPNGSDLDLFARSLRIKQNDKLSFIGKALGFFTTPVFKKNGISGWLPDPAAKECGDDPETLELRVLPVLCATGKVKQKARSTDGLETIDMKITEIESCPEEGRPCSDKVILNEAHGFKLPRYIRN